MPSFGYLSRGKLRFFAVFLDFLPSYLGSILIFREKVPEFSRCSLPDLVFFD
ncbi:hypothetical protein N0824_01546 [Microcystis sp. 0824]|nr:hypothetical protein N0824_01546 [Microcystis sp. 0824]